MRDINVVPVRSVRQVPHVISDNITFQARGLYCHRSGNNTFQSRYLERTDQQAERKEENSFDHPFWRHLEH